MDSDNNIIISDSTLRNIFPPQLKNMTSWYKVICGCECSISDKIMHSSLLSYHKIYAEKLMIKVVIWKTEGLMKWTVTYLRYNKILLFHMVSMCSKNHLTWLWQQWVQVHHKNIHYRLVNVCCVVVQNFHILIYQLQNQIITIKMLVLQ